MCSPFVNASISVVNGHRKTEGERPTRRKLRCTELRTRQELVEKSHHLWVPREKLTCQSSIDRSNLLYGGVLTQTHCQPRAAMTVLNAALAGEIPETTKPTSRWQCKQIRQKCIRNENSRWISRKRNAQLRNTAQRMASAADHNSTR